MRVYGDEEVVVLSPDRLGYKDRGIMKWQGLILSDHVEAMKKDKAKREKTYPIDKEQEEQVIGEQLYFSLVRKRWVSIQENILDGSDYVKPIIGVVLGIRGQHIIVQTMKEKKTVLLSDIRHVKPYDYNKWQTG